MASGHSCKLLRPLSRLFSCTALHDVQKACLVPVRQKYTLPPIDDPNCNVQIGVSSNGKTVVCYHPTVDIPYEHTQPIERPDPLTDAAETHDQVLKAHLSKEVLLKDKKGPTIEELSQMFFTTKHRWYPVGQYHTRRKKKDPPKDR